MCCDTVQCAGVGENAPFGLLLKEVDKEPAKGRAESLMSRHEVAGWGVAPPAGLVLARDLEGRGHRYTQYALKSRLAFKDAIPGGLPLEGQSLCVWATRVLRGRAASLMEAGSVKRAAGMCTRVLHRAYMSDMTCEAGAEAEL